MKNIILTGTSSGFGLLTAQTLARQGHTVFATMRNVHTRNVAAAASLTGWAKDNKLNIEVVELDVTDDASVMLAMVSIAEKTNGHMDVLINNAGTAYTGLNETLSAAQTDQIFQINVIGVDRMIKGVLPYMHKNKDGLIITLSSVVSRQCAPIMGTYSASKAAVDSLSVSYYYELRNTGIDVAIVQPGAFPTTDIISKQMTPANPSAENYYGEDMHYYKKAVEKYFEPTPSSPDPQIVADLIVELIKTPKGQRQLWSIVGGGPFASAVNDINAAIRQLADTIVGRRAVPS